MEIRELTAEDLPSLLELYIQLDEANKDMTLEHSREVWEKEIKNNKYIKYFGVVDNGKVVSTCYCVIMPNLTHNGKSICYVENVVTDINYRKQGLAKKVIYTGLEFAKQNNCYKAVLMSNVKRVEAHKFYEKIGFKGDSKKAFVYSM